MLLWKRPAWRALCSGTNSVGPFGLWDVRHGSCYRDGLSSQTAHPKCKPRPLHTFLAEESIAFPCCSDARRAIDLLDGTRTRPTAASGSARLDRADTQANWRLASSMITLRDGIRTGLRCAKPSVLPSNRMPPSSCHLSAARNAPCAEDCSISLRSRAIARLRCRNHLKNRHAMPLCSAKKSLSRWQCSL